MKPSSLRPRNLLTAGWTFRAVRKIDRQLAAHVPVKNVAVPQLPVGAGRRPEAVYAVTRRLHPTCLVEALVLQAWLRHQGIQKDVVIGVQRVEGQFKAHAWIEGDEESGGASYESLTRFSG